jgi:hypothetical protein
MRGDNSKRTFNDEEISAKGVDLPDKSPQTIRLLAAEIAQPFVTIDRHGAIFTNTGYAGIRTLLLAVPFTIR